MGMGKMSSMKSFIHLANRIAAKQDPLPIDDGNPFNINEQSDMYDFDDYDVTKGKTEYSCRVELHLEIDCEGEVTKEVLLKKIRTELKNSIESGIKVVTGELDLSSVRVKVRPMVMELAILDESEEGMDEYGNMISESEESLEYESSEDEEDSEDEESSQSEEHSEDEDSEDSEYEDSEDSEDDDSEDEEAEDSEDSEDYDYEVQDV